MNELLIDIETYSEADLAKVGVYRYASDSSFEILLFAYSIDGSEVEVVDIAQGGKIPPQVLDALSDNSIKKFSFNSTFERICLSRFLGMPVGKYLDPNGWFCDMVWSASLGLPMSLENVGYVLGLDKKKLSVGKDLIRYFCKPCEPTKSNGGRTRNLPHHDFDKWNLFISYNKRDVEAELEIHKRLERFPLPDVEWENYHIHEASQDLGIMLDMDFVHHAISVDTTNSEINYQKAQEITGVDNPNSPKQLKEWLMEQGEQEVESLSKSEIKRLLEGASGNVEEILKLRQEMAKTSVKKYSTMELVVCSDNRARGLIQFYGSHTGRFAGRLIQVQNLVANHIPDLEYAKELVRKEDIDAITKKYGSVSQVLSELVRTAFIPKEGHIFLVADFSQIESRVLSYLAGETWSINAFKEGKDLYCETARMMFGKPVEKNGVNAELRKYGKIATLACGYGGSVGALKAFGAIALGIEEKELPSIITNWRSANPHIVKMWWDIDKDVKYVLTTGDSVTDYGFTFSYSRGILFIKLPSGRSLAYCKPRIGINDFGSECFQYEGVNGTNKKWQIISSYGPRIVENLTQAVARDCLTDAIRRLVQKGYRILMTVHDEVVIEAPIGSSLDEVSRIMGESPTWAKDLCLRADGYVAEKFYFKE